jgi:8-oxo-dGTP diphosphatase
MRSVVFHLDEPLPPRPDHALRRALDALVTSIDPVDGQEAADRDEALAWIRRGAPLWRAGHPGDPAGPSPHLVAYTVVVDPDLGALYLAENRRTRRWLAPGGHVRPGERPEHAAHRKLAEELGLRAPLLGGLATNPLFCSIHDTAGDVPHRDVCLWYVFAASVTSGMQWDAEQVVRTRWWTFDEARLAHPALLAPALIRFIDKLETELS